MSANAATTESLRKAVAEVLSEGKVDVVIGYARENGMPLASPVFIRKAQDAERLVFDDLCFGNLAVYLPRSELRGMGRMGVVVKGCDLKAVNVLLRENVIQREDVLLIGVHCSGVGEPQSQKCSVCDSHSPQGCDIVVGDSQEAPQPDATLKYSDAAAIDEMSLEQRWEFWQGQLSKCIRCYACRQVCPLCYCKRCIIEKSTPQWVETSPHLRGNLAWHVARAFHLDLPLVSAYAICGMVAIGIILPAGPGLVGNFHEFGKFGLQISLSAAVIAGPGMAFIVAVHGLQAVRGLLPARRADRGCFPCAAPAGMGTAAGARRPAERAVVGVLEQ